MSKSKEDLFFKINSVLSYGETFYHGEQVKQAMEEYSRSQCIAFFNYEIGELKKLLEYNDKVGEEINGKELIRMLTTFQTRNTESRYQDFIQHQSQPKEDPRDNPLIGDDDWYHDLDMGAR